MTCVYYGWTDFSSIAPPVLNPPTAVTATTVGHSLVVLWTATQYLTPTLSDDVVQDQYQMV